MKKILLTARNFPPLTGGMERLMFHTYKELTSAYDVYLVGPPGCSLHADPGQAKSFRLTPNIAFLLDSSRVSLLTALRFKPDLIISGSGATAPQAFMTGKIAKAPVLAFVHGLDLIVDNRLYKGLFLPCIKQSTGVIANSNNTARLAQNTGIDPSKIQILHPGVSIPLPILDSAAEKFRHKINAGSRPILLSIGRLTPRKGLAEFIENSMLEIVRKIPDIFFVIIGAEAKDSLAGPAPVKSQIEETISRHRLNKNIRILGTVDDKTLNQAYAASNLFVFPVLDLPGDVEGFGMVALEAASHGLPTIAFASGGVPDAVKEATSGFLIQPGNYKRFAQTAISYLRGEKTGISKESCKKFAQGFSWDKYGAKLRTICASVLDSQER